MENKRIKKLIAKIERDLAICDIKLCLYPEAVNYWRGEKHALQGVIYEAKKLLEDNGIE